MLKNYDDFVNEKQVIISQEIFARGECLIAEMYYKSADLDALRLQWTYQNTICEINFKHDCGLYHDYIHLLDNKVFHTQTHQPLVITCII